MSDSSSCRVCGSHALTGIEGYSDLPRVTSDSRPWSAGGGLFICLECDAIQKLPTTKWLSEIGDIYASYNLWPLSNGSEQPIFLSDYAPKPRSELLIDFLRNQIAIAQKGALLDIGCGTGAALANFGNLFPSWSLYAADLSERALPVLSRIPGFKTLFTQPLNKINRRFDLVTMIHSLEHFSSPTETLAEVRNLLGTDGVLLVQVPNGEISPFDLLVVDHLVHFGPRQLALSAGRAGLEIRHLRDDFLPKELTMVALPGVVSSGEWIAADSWSVKNATKKVQWLHAILDKANSVADVSHSLGRPFGIFGSSIAGMWLYGALQGKVDFFVDEDIARQGSVLDRRPIMNPEDVPEDAEVFLALLPETAIRVSQRMAVSPGRYILPPSLNLSEN
ncbi:MAG: class I SAM-dependent methyltransferase [Sterolibacteriaceae bacterium MAG5]|nr:class I SAM-dependent methyltransferase [Candidatus Nitricoxidireducens bremensis]